ncbi:MAG: SDR family NAD(P)-dependent oxidoreductase [Vicinamibacterales bacterium]|jgi:hypothetical protein
MSILTPGNIAVVTGGSSGIGQAVAAALTDLELRVVIASDRVTDLERAAGELSAQGRLVDRILCDVQSREAVERMAVELISRYGRVDLLINNAGYAVYRSFEESSLDEIESLLDVNLAGAMRCTKAFLPSMISRRAGRIVNIASLAGGVIITPNAVYCAAKHGMVAWTRTLRYELDRFGLSANVVCPGLTKTRFHDHPTFQRRQNHRRDGRSWMMPEQVAAQVIRAIRRDRAVTYVPGWQGLVAWALAAAPFAVEPLWGRVMRKRISALYED